MEEKIKRIVWTEPAKKDLLKVYDFLFDISEVIAEKQIERIINRVEILETGFTKIGQKEPLLEDRKEEYRYLVQDNCKIIYKEKNDDIIILSVFDARQNPIKIRKIE